MPLNYEKKSRLVGFGDKTVKTEKVIPVVRRSETVTSDELIQQIHLNTLLPAAVIKNVLSAMVESLKTYFVNGHGAYVTDKFGILYPRLVKEQDEEGSVTLSVGVGFRPCSEFKEMLSHISVHDISKSTKDADDEATDTDSTDNGGSATPSDDESGM